MFLTFRLFLALVAFLSTVTFAVPVPGAGQSSIIEYSVGPLPAAEPFRPAAPGSTIVVNQQTYTLTKIFTPGLVAGAVYATADGKAAKQFRTRCKTNKKYSGTQLVVWTEEVKNTRIILGPDAKAVNAGESMVNGDGETYAWIITTLMKGQHIAQTPGFKAVKAKGTKECLAWVTDVLRPEFKRKWVAFAKQHGIVHLDAHRGNTFWKPDGKTIEGFIDYDHMGKVGGKAYKLAAQQLYMHIKLKKLAKPEALSVEDMGELFAEKYFPVDSDWDMCTPGGHI